jgi:two-component system NtrC family sensor kinase
LLASFLLISILPVTAVTVFSLDWFKQALNKELTQRFQSQAREIQDLWLAIERDLTRESNQQAQDKNLLFELLSGNTAKLRERARIWLGASPSKVFKIYNADGRLLIFEERGPGNQISSRTNLEANSQWAEGLVERVARLGKLNIVDFADQLELVHIAQLRATGNHSVGFIEKIIRVDGDRVRQIRERFAVELIFVETERRKMTASFALDETNQRRLFKHATEQRRDVFQMTVKGRTYAFYPSSLPWGEDKVDFYLATDFQASVGLIDKINTTFGTVLLVVIIVLALLAFALSRVVFRPVEALLAAIRSIETTGQFEGRLRDNRTEIGLLAERFNEMARKIHESQSALKRNIIELEQANQAIKSTQSQLVQSTKMASLGQLVAGVAHELNNPIGFIYSNLAHLREYADQLTGLVDDLAANKLDLEQAKAKHEYEFIKQDLPRLLQACEDGAQRTRDIVLGLRNFSRLDEAERKEVDIHEGLDNTLRLLSGELKNRVRVIKKYGPLPKVICFPSQLNQVFMNVLTNAAQAIDGEGEVTIETIQVGSEVQVRITDTGRGMSPAVLEKVFDPFFTTKAESKGTGLGMSISYGIIQKHGGRIEVRSVEGQGSTFTIILPIQAN